jgi:hypothetical protein
MRAIGVWADNSNNEFSMKNEWFPATLFRVDGEDELRRPARQKETNLELFDLIGITC